MSTVLRSVAMAIAAGAMTVCVASCGGSSTTSPSSSGPAPCLPRQTGPSATTASYMVTLNVGPVETMWSQQQANAQHPTTGEVMLGGVMSMASGADARHLEAHVCSRSTNTVVSNVSPTITMQDTTAPGATPQAVPVSVMQGVTSGPSDLHYGNNVIVSPGHSYTATVTVNGETATIPFTAQ